MYNLNNNDKINLFTKYASHISDRHQISELDYQDYQHIYYVPYQRSIFPLRWYDTFKGNFYWLFIAYRIRSWNLSTMSLPSYFLQIGQSHNLSRLLCQKVRKVLRSKQLACRQFQPLAGVCINLFVYGSKQEMLIDSTWIYQSLLLFKRGLTDIWLRLDVTILIYKSSTFIFSTKNIPSKNIPFRLSRKSLLLGNLRAQRENLVFQSWLELADQKMQDDIRWLASFLLLTLWLLRMGGTVKMLSPLIRNLQLSGYVMCVWPARMQVNMIQNLPVAHMLANDFMLICSQKMKFYHQSKQNNPTVYAVLWNGSLIFSLHPKHTLSLLQHFVWNCLLQILQVNMAWLLRQPRHIQYCSISYLYIIIYYSLWYSLRSCFNCYGILAVCFSSNFLLSLGGRPRVGAQCLSIY